MGRWHAHAARQAGAKVAAVADVDLDRARRIALPYGAEIFVSGEAMIKVADVSVLHICTPTPSHAELAQTLLSKNKHLLIEKPLADNVFQTRELLANAQKVDRQLWPVHQYFFQRSVSEIFARLPDAGDLTSVELKFYTAGAENIEPGDYLKFTADILPHPLSIIQKLFPQKSLSEVDWSVSSSLNGEWCVDSTIDKSRVHIVISVLARPTTAFLRVSGTRGTFEADLFHDYLVWLDGKATRSTKITQPFVRSGVHLFAAAKNLAGRAMRKESAYPGLKALISDFYDACTNEKHSTISSKQIIDVAIVRDKFLNEITSASGVALQLKAR